MVISEVKKESCKKCKGKGISSRSNAVSKSSTMRRLHTTCPSGNLENDTPPITDRPISPLQSDLEYRERLIAEVELCALQEKIDYKDLTVNSVLNGSFHDVRAMLRQLDARFDAPIILETMLHFSLVICGLPKCPIEDLPLAVYLFIEDTFDIKSKIELCSKLNECDGKIDVGVVFNSIRMKYKVLKNDVLLEGTEVRIKDNKCIFWITKELENNGLMC